MSDPEGRALPGKLLHTYLRTRLGQCVSMPTLFLILAERLGVEVAFAAAPEHVFVRYRDEAGQWLNLETTSGAHPARDAWYIEKFPVTELSIRSGLYLRTQTNVPICSLSRATCLGGFLCCSPKLNLHKRPCKD